MHRLSLALVLATVFAPLAVAAPPPVFERIDAEDRILVQRGPGAAKRGQPPVDPAEWYLAGNHLHTSVGGDHSWHHGLTHLLEKSDAQGLDFAIVTDHNTIDHWSFPEFKPFGKTIPIRGEEWTSDDGHAGLVMFEPAGGPIIPCTRPSAGRPCEGGQPDYKRMVDEVHRRGGFVIINHPKLARHIWPDDSLGADAVDIAWNLTDTKGKKARAWWHSLLVRGQRPIAIGGSDYHYFLWPREKAAQVPPGTVPGRPLPDGTVLRVPGLEEGIPEGAEPGTLVYPIPSLAKPVNLVRASAKTPEALMSALRAGHLIVLAEPSSPRAFLGADITGDGKFTDAREGDRLSSIAPGATVRFQARVIGGKGKTLRILDPKLETSVKVTSGDFVHAFERRRAAAESFVRLEIGDDGECAGNPIFY